LGKKVREKTTYERKEREGKKKGKERKGKEEGEKRRALGEDTTSSTTSRWRILPLLPYEALLPAPHVQMV
jgi:hypothetical protein